MIRNKFLFVFVAAKFLLYIVFMFLTFSYFTFYGMMAVGLTPNQHLAAVISSAFYSLWNLLSGFLIPKPVSHKNALLQPIYINHSKVFGVFLFLVFININIMELMSVGQWYSSPGVFIWSFLICPLPNFCLVHIAYSGNVIMDFKKNQYIIPCKVIKIWLLVGTHKF